MCTQQKKIFMIFLLVGIMVLSLIGAKANSQTKDNPLIIKGVTGFPKPNLLNDFVPLLIEKINKQSMGRVKIEWLGGPEVFAAFDQLHALRDGAINMLIQFPVSWAKSIIPEAEAKGLTELFPWEERKSGAFELWSEIFEKRAKAKYLGNPYVASYYLYCNRKIDKLDDLKGLKVRTMPLYTPLLKALGTAPITIAPADLYTAMERGVVDGFMWTKFGVSSMGVQEVTKYIVEPGVYQTATAALINLDFWKKIPKDLQDMLMDAVQDIEYIGTMRAILIEKKDEEIMKKAGMKIISLSPEESSKYIKLAYDSAWEQVLKDSPEYGSKLRKVMSKGSVPKGAFPWY